MTTGVLELAAWPAPDRAYGEEAKELRRILTEFTETPDVTETFGNRLRTLNAAFRDAAVEDWDGRGATPVDQETYHVARSFLNALPVTVPDPSISIDPDGEASFTWVRRRGATFSVSVGRDGTLSFAGIYGSKSNYGTESFIEEIPASVRGNLARLFPQGTTETVGNP